MAADPSPAVLPYAAPAQKTNRLAFLFRALDSRNYRLFFAGQFISLIGTWLTNMATGWLVYRLTDSSATLGWVNFAGQIPAFVLTPFAGVMVDRWRRRNLLVWTQTLSMLESFGLAVLAFSVAGHGITVSPHGVTLAVTSLFGLAAFQGLVNAFDVPARQSFVVDLMERREDLPNAIALNSSMFNAARLLGPAVAGYLIYKVGEGWCFSLDGISYIAVIVALLMMRVVEKPKPKTHRHVLVDMKEGLRYVANFKSIRDILLLLAFVSLVGTPTLVLMPVFATKVLHGDARTQGILMAFSAAGALGGAILLAARKSVLGLGRLMPLATAGLGIGLVIFGFSHQVWLSGLALVITGFCMMTQMAAGNTLLQTLVDDKMRGRVMSLFTMAFMGMMPVGALIAGNLASDAMLGPQWTTVVSGVACTVIASVFTLRLPAIRKELRPIYVKRGILPEAAAGVEAADGVLEESER
jgi:MFS family permease